MPPSSMQPPPGSNQPLQAFLQHQKDIGWYAAQRADSAGPAAPVGDPAQQVLAQAAERYGQRRYQESAALYSQLTTSRLFADQGHYGLGVIALAQGDRAGAATHFGNAVAVNPRFANAHFYLGELREQAADPAGALAHYRQALASNASHAGAARAVGRLSGAGPAHVAGPPPATMPPPTMPPPAAMPPPAMAPPPATTPPALLDVGLPPGAAGLGVYEYLRSDSTLLAQQTVSKLEALELRRHAALAAWTGGLLVRAIGLFVILVAVAIFQLSTNVDINQDVLWVVAGLLLAVYLLRAATTVYEISGGRLTVERGILWRRIRQVELWRIQGIERRQGLIDRITGHGELRFTTVSAPGGVIKVRGLARGRRLKDIHAQLVDLVFLLRSNPVVKGIIS